MVHAEGFNFYKHPARLDFGNGYLSKGNFLGRGDFIYTYCFYISLPPCDSLNMAILKAVSAMQTVLIMDNNLAVLHIYRPLRTDGNTSLAADTFLTDKKPFRL